MKVSDELFEMLATLRGESGWSYAEMGRRSGMSHSSFSRLFHRVTKTIDPDMVDALARLFSVDPAALLEASLGHAPKSGAAPDDIAAAMARRFAALEPADRAFVLAALERAEKS